MADEPDAYVRDFVQESEEHLARLNTALLELERTPEDDEAIEEIFRTAHTLKGNCAAMGLDAASDLAHGLEDLLEAVRAGDVAVTAERMDVVFDAVDALEAVVDDVAATGDPVVRENLDPTIEAIRAPLESDADSAATQVDAPSVEVPTEDELDALLDPVDPPADDGVDGYVVRMAITEGDGEQPTNGALVVEALIDAFDLLATDPDRDAIDAGDYDGRVDAVFASAVGESAIAAALEPVDQVAAFDIRTVTDRLERQVTEPGRPADADADAAGMVPDDDLVGNVSVEEANEMSVDDLLDEFEELDDLDALVEEMDEDGDDAFADLGEAGSFADLLGEETSAPTADEPAAETDPAAGPSAGDESGPADAEPATETGDEPVDAAEASAEPAPDDEPEDASAVFEELKDEVEMVGFDELQDELDELEFDEFDEEEVGMEELLGDDVDTDDPSFLSVEDDASADEIIETADPVVEPDEPTDAAESGEVDDEPAEPAPADAEPTEVDAESIDDESPDRPASSEPASADADDVRDGESVAASDATVDDVDAADDRTDDVGTAFDPIEDLDVEPDTDVDQALADSIDVGDEFGVDTVDDDFGEGDFEEDAFDDVGSADDSLDEEEPFDDAFDVDSTADFDGAAAFEYDDGSFDADDASAEPWDDAADAETDAETFDAGFDDAPTTDANDFDDGAALGDDAFSAATTDVAGFDDADDQDDGEADEPSSPIDRLPDLTVPDLDLPERSGRDDARDAVDTRSRAVRVDREQIDTLLTLVEGLVTSRVRLRHAVESGEDHDVIGGELDDLEDITSDLQETVMDVRLVSLQTVTNRLPRIVRDVARDQGKEVAFEQTGADVDLDRQILDRIGDPLIHLVRNAVDHGIEPPAEREAADKPPEGSVELRAERERDRVRISVVDDGRGLDPDRLREEAVAAEALTRAEADDLTDEAALDLAFHPGLSTAEEVTDVSGRGVGMDVVRRTIEDLNGSTAIRSEPGSGTTVTMELPVTVAIADVLFVSRGGEEFGIPVEVVQDVVDAGLVETGDATLAVAGGGRLTAFGGGDPIEPADAGDGNAPFADADESIGEDGTPLETSDAAGASDDVPVVDLAGALDAADDGDQSVAETNDADGRGDDGTVVRIREDVRPIALRCDEVRGRQEVVVTPFEGFLSDVPGVSGATVRGRGEVVTILDVSTL